MKKLVLFIALLFIGTAHANSSNFNTYVGIDMGANISEYNYNLNLDEIYYSATLNAGLRIGHNFGAELFFTHSSSNSLEYIADFDAVEHEIYYMAFGFDIYAYYNMTRQASLFTSFGVANYKIYYKSDYVNLYNSYEEKESDNTVTTRLGLGFIYTFPSDGISILAQYQYTPLNNVLFNNMSEFSVGFRYNF